jgi:hypothetical protein
VADIVKIVTAPQGTTTETVGTGIGTTEVEAEVEVETGTGTGTDTEAEGDMAGMTDVSATDPPALLGTMMTIRDVLPTMKMTDAQVTAAGTTTVAVSAAAGVGEVVMTGASEVSVAVVADVTVVAEGRMASAPPKEDPRPRKVPFPCRRGGGKRLDGMFQLPAMSSIPLCRPNKPVFPSLMVFLSCPDRVPGLFNLPGANRTQIPPILGIAGLPPPMPVQSFGMGIGGNPNLSRQSRRLYIGSITPEVTEQNLADFFNVKMEEMKIGTGGPGNPVLAVQCNYEKNYAFVEVTIFQPMFLFICGLPFW